LFIAVQKETKGDKRSQMEPKGPNRSQKEPKREPYEANSCQRWKNGVIGRHLKLLRAIGIHRDP
jgi:hypothetical protein